MKKRFSVKKFLTAVFAGVCCVCSGAAFATLDTEETAFAATEQTFDLVGASVRKADPDGIRFIAQLDTQELSAYGDAKYGMILIPQDMDDGSDMTVTYDGTTYTPSNSSAVVVEGGDFWSEDLRAANGIAEGYSAFSCALMADQGDGASVVKFPEAFYNRPITAVGFIIPESGETVYTDKVTRSISYVATVESLKADYEQNEVVEKIAQGATTTLTVGGNNKIENYEDAVAPVLTVGGMTATSMLNVTYTSSNTSVAEIVDGKVQAVSEGTTTITATATAGGGSKVIATAEVTVELTTYVVTANQNFTAGGSVTGTGEYAYNTNATLTATANTDYTFLGWYEGATLKSSSATYTFKVTGDVTLTAKFSAIIGLNTEYWARSNASTTTLSGGTTTFTNAVVGDSIYTKSQYSNFILQYDATGLTASNMNWFGVIYGSTSTAPYYGANDNNFVFFRRLDWNAIYWCPNSKDELGTVGTAISEQLLTADTVNVKMVVSDGTATFTLTFPDGTSVTSAAIACMSGLTTTGYVAIPCLEGGTYTVKNLSLIDLDGRDFNAAPTTVTSTMSDLNSAGKVKINGRTAFDGSALVLRNAAAGFEINTNSSKVTISVSAGYHPSYIQYLKVWVDGVESVLIINYSTATTVVLAQNLSTDTQHTIKVAKMTEDYLVSRSAAEYSAYGNVFIHSISCLSDGAIAQAPAASSLKIEVYGDSITCGYGALGDVSVNPTSYTSEEEDATATYAYKTAQTLGADLSVIAHQGWGIMRTNNNSQWLPDTNFSISGCEEPLGSGTRYDGVWDKVTENSSTAWDFSSYVPDIIVIALGTNDYVNYQTDDDNYLKFYWNYLTFMYNLQNTYQALGKTPKFVLCYGMMDGGGRLASTVEYIAQSASDGSAMGVVLNSIAVDLTGTDGTYMGGGGSHPSAAQHTTAASNLVAALRNAGWIS